MREGSSPDPSTASTSLEAARRARAILSILALCCVIAFGFALVLREDRGGTVQGGHFFTVASASPGGQYHSRVVDSLCRPYNDDEANGDDRCLAIPTGGSVTNLECLRAGEVDFALAQADACLGPDAPPLPSPEQGTPRIACADLEGPPRPMTVLGRAHVESLHILTRRGFAGAQTLDELAATTGETIRISLGAPGSGTYRAALYAFDLAGLDLDATIGGERPLFETRDFTPDQLVEAICQRTDLDIGMYMIGEDWLADADIGLNDPCGDGAELVILPLADSVRSEIPYRIGTLGGARVLQVDAYLLAGREDRGATPERRAALQALLNSKNDPAPDDLPETCFHPGIAR